MPYSFTQIEKDKSKTIGFVFVFLIVFYFAVFWVLLLLLKNFFSYEVLAPELAKNFSYPHPSPREFSIIFFSLKENLVIFVVACMAGWLHWVVSVHSMVADVLRFLRAEDLNPKDSHHNVLQNLIEEVMVATGNQKQIRGVVVPTMAMNAFALSDFKGNNIIGVTEGMLARLTRDQLSAVVAHEAAHIMTEDGLSTSVITSLSELYSGLLRAFDFSVHQWPSSRRRYSYGRKDGNRDFSLEGRIILFIALVYFILCFTRFMGMLLRAFISREREYRADAIAVRLTRNPLALAEALYAITHYWHGDSLASEELEAIFIVNPQFSALENREGMVADLFSTHPPINKRIGLLLEMAHADISVIEKNLERQMNKSKEPVPQLSTSAYELARPSQWLVNHDGHWEGPFNVAQLGMLKWLEPGTWVKRLGEDNVKTAQEDQELISFIKEEEFNRHTALGCPRCHVPLNKLSYESLEVDRCPFCHGTLVKQSDVERLIIRQEVAFDEHIQEIAKRIEQETIFLAHKKISMHPDKLLICPVCNPPRKMLKRFYTEVYRVEVDYCIQCQNVWFDRDELEVLQCMIERGVAKTKVA
jgi:heat shock protein HtpX